MNLLKSRRKSSWLLLLAVSSSLTLTGFTGDAEARVGGSRSSGSRGYRGFSQPRTTPYRGTAPQTQPYTSPYRAAPNSPQYQGRSPFWSGLAGGLAGGALGSLLFRNSGYGGVGGVGGGGMGLLDLLLIGGLIYFAFRMFRRRSHGHGQTNPLFTRGGDSGLGGAYEKVQNLRGTGPYASSAQDEYAWADTIRSSDPSFDLARFKDQRLDDFMRIQAAWNHRDLSSVRSMIGPELTTSLQEDIEDLKRKGRINRVENIAVRGTELVEAWQEYGKEFATVRFQASLTDYTVDEKSQEVLSGDRVQPVKFAEDWTFVRDAADPRSEWKLSAIQQVSESAA